MASRPTKSTSDLYAKFMSEAKVRLEEIGFRLELIKSDPTAATAPLEAEFAYLQTRFVCELVALAALAAHHSLGLGSELLKTWSAERIFERLETINPHSFPVSIRYEKDETGIAHFSLAPGRRMQRANLKEIYNQCGQALHAGIMKHFLKGQNRVLDLGKLQFWQSEFMSLLTEHAVLIPQEERVLLINLFGGSDGGVFVAEAVADGPFAVLTGE